MVNFGLRALNPQPTIHEYLPPSVPSLKHLVVACSTDLLTVQWDRGLFAVETSKKSPTLTNMRVHRYFLVIHRYHAVF